MKDGKSYETTNSSVVNLLGNITTINVDRVVSKNPDKFSDYSVDDSLGTRIQLHAGSKKIGDLVIGRFSFNQATRSGISYLRLHDEKDVFSSEGFLSMSLSQGFDNYRNKKIMSVNSTDITRISNMGTQDRSLQKVGSVWQDQEGNMIDSSAMASYLGTLSSVSGTDFAEGVASASGESIEAIRFEGNNMSRPVEVKLFQSADTSHQFVLHSSENPEAYFYSDSSGVYNRLFGKYFELGQELQE